MAVAGQTGAAQDADLRARVEAHVKAYVDAHEFAGVVLVATSDAILVERAFGMADRELGVEHTLDGVFPIASLSKTFTAAAIAILEDRGRLQWDDTLSAFFPTELFASDDELETHRVQDITVKMLLLHRAGLAEMHQRSNQGSNGVRPLPLADQVARILQEPLRFEPGTDEAYSNTGYMVLARIVEIVSGSSFSDFLEEELCSPLGLENTGIGEPGERVSGRVRSYLPGPPPAFVRNAEGIGANSVHQLGASEMYSTAKDLLAWLRAVAAESPVDLRALSYPYGWGRRTHHGELSYEQSGLERGHATVMAFYPDRDLFVITLSNLRAGAAFNRLHIELAGLAFGRTPPRPKSRQFDLDRADSEWCCGSYDFPELGELKIASEGPVLTGRWVAFDLDFYLYPLKDGGYWNAMDGVEVHFERDSSDPRRFASSLVWGTGNGAMRAHRRDRPQSAYLGRWEGVATFESTNASDRLRMDLELYPDSGRLMGRASFPELGILGQQTTLTESESGLVVHLPDAGGVQRMELTRRGDALLGGWALGQDRSAQVALRSTANDSRPSVRRSVSWAHTGVRLAGDLLLPNGPSPHPLVVFVHGSGSETRHSSRFLADCFARRGIAALIFDKRGTGKSTGDWRTADFDELADDVVEAIAWARRHEEIDPHSIGLHGTSQGGWIAPLVAARLGDLAFLIVNSGPLVPPAREGHWDAILRLRRSGLSTVTIEQRVHRALDVFDEVVRTRGDPRSYLVARSSLESESWFEIAQLPRTVDPTKQGWGWYRSVMDFDPVPLYEELDLPILALYGSADESIDAAESAGILQQIADRTEHPITIRWFEGHDHGLRATIPTSAPWRKLPSDYPESMVQWALEVVRAPDRE